MQSFKQQIIIQLIAPVLTAIILLGSFFITPLKDYYSPNDAKLIVFILNQSKYLVFDEEKSEVGQQPESLKEKSSADLQIQKTSCKITC